MEVFPRKGANKLDHTQFQQDSAPLGAESRVSLTETTGYLSTGPASFPVVGQTNDQTPKGRPLWQQTKKTPLEQALGELAQAAHEAAIQKLKALNPAEERLMAAYETYAELGSNPADEGRVAKTLQLYGLMESAPTC